MRYTDLLTPHPGQSLGPRGCNTRTHRALNVEVARTADTWLRQAHILIGNYHIATDPCKRCCYHSYLKAPASEDITEPMREQRVSLQHFHTLIMFRQHGNLAFIGHEALDFAEVWW